MRSVFTVALLLLHFLSAFSQQYNFRCYSIGEGLAQSQVYSMVEDNQGYLWFGTRGGGLSRFDGINFTNYTVQEGLPSNYIKILYKGTDGKVWIGTDEGLSYFNGKSFVNYGTSKGLYNLTVNSIIQDKSKTIWLATEDGIFVMEKDTIVRFGRKLGVPLQRFSCLYEDAQSNIWAGSDHGLFKFTNLKGQWSYQFFTIKDGIPGNIITSIEEDLDKNIWITTYGGGAGMLKDSIWNIYKAKDGLGSNTIYTCSKGKDKTLWFGTAYGATKCDTSGGGFVFTNFTETEGLANNTVMCLMKDSFDDMWFGTSGGGVSKLGSERFTHFTAIKGLFGSWVYAIHEDSLENLWFATSEGGVTKYDGKFYQRISEKDGFTASKVKCIHKDVSGNLWFGTVADGAYLYNGKSFRHFNGANGLGSNFINYIVSDSSGKIFMATAGGGISILYPKNGRYKVQHIKPSDGLPGDRVNAIFYDRGFLWAAMAGAGICKIFIAEDKDSMKIETYGYKQGVKSNNIRSIAKDKYGRLFFGTADAGILAYNGNKFVRISVGQGLLSNNIYSLIFDTEDHLWVGTEKGIDRVLLTDDLKVKESRHYGRPEGFIGIETIQNAVFKDREGNIWFGSVKGATRYNPGKDRSERLPRVMLTEITLFFDPIQNTPYGKDLNYSGENYLLSLPYNQNHLSFQFIGIEHSNPEAVNYQWKLEGFDKQWSPATKKTEAIYSNLSPGKYTFKVMAAGESGKWPVQPAVFTFEITPPFWKRWWFYIMSILVGIAIIWLLISLRYQRIRKKNEQEREKLIVEKTLLEYEQKALRLQMNPHFLFNCLNSIKGLIAEGKADEAKLYLAKFSKLMRSILENSGSAFISLENEIGAIKNYVELEKLNLGEGLELIIDVDSSIDIYTTAIPSMLIQPFVENSIVHGIAPKKDKGWIKLHFVKVNHHLKCIIEDNGVGRSVSESKKMNSIADHKSAAISITQDRLNIINKNLNFEEIKIEIRDKEEQSGTIVELLIPYQLV